MIVRNKATIIITTYKRLDKLQELLDSIEIYTDPDLYDLLVMVDNSDWDTYSYLNHLDIPCMLSHDKKDWVGQTNYAIDICMTEHFVFICDDWLCVESDWLKKGLKHFKEAFPDNCGLLVFNDYIQEEYSNIVRPIKLKDGSEIKMATHGLSSKTFVKHLGGELLHSGYKHYSADCELALRAHQMGRYYYLRGVVLKHNHHIHTGIRDDVYDHSEKENFLRDRNLYVLRNGEYIK